MSLLVATFVTAFSAAAVKAHIRFLADDLLEGRGTGTRGHRIAASYVAAQFEAAGLETSFQEVPFRATMPSAESTLTLLREGEEPVTLRAFESFVTQGDALRSDNSIEAPVVFAGFGITAPDQKYDDYAGIDVRGKIAAVFTGAPPSFPNEVRAHHSASLNKIDNAARHGDGRVEVELREGVLTVRDHGPGIAADDLPYVFDRFYRSTAARGRPGSGLGLAIVRQAAEAHGGSVRAGRAPGGGAELTLALPRSATS